MPVMQVGIVRVRVGQRLVAMPMRMRLADLPFMPVLMMIVMHMDVLMFERFVAMFVDMALGEVKP